MLLYQNYQDLFIVSYVLRSDSKYRGNASLTLDMDILVMTTVVRC